MFKNRITITIITFLLFFSICGIAQNAGNYDIEGLPEIKIIHAHPSSPEDFKHTHASALAFKKYVENNSQGKITVEIVPGGELGNESELFEQLQAGVIHGMNCTEGHLAAFWPPIQAPSIPYLFRSEDHAALVFDGDFGEKFFEAFRKATGTRVISLFDNGGFRNFTNSIRPIHTPEDMKGLTIRTMEIPAHMELVKRLGAEPIPVDWLELYTALQTGVVEGQENSIPVIDMGAIHEVQKYLTTDKHVISLQMLLINDEWFQNLPNVYQLIIKNGGREATIEGRRSSRIGRDVLREKFENLGVEIYDPTVEELKKFQEVTQEPVLEFIRKDIGDEWVDMILEAAEKTILERFEPFVK